MRCLRREDGGGAESSLALHRLCELHEHAAAAVRGGRRPWHVAALQAAASAAEPAVVEAAAASTALHVVSGVVKALWAAEEASDAADAAAVTLKNSQRIAERLAPLTRRCAAALAAAAADAATVLLAAELLEAHCLLQTLTLRAGGGASAADADAPPRSAEAALFGAACAQQAPPLLVRRMHACLRRVLWECCDAGRPLKDALAGNPLLRAARDASFLTRLPRCQESQEKAVAPLRASLEGRDEEAAYERAHAALLWAVAGLCGEEAAAAAAVPEILRAALGSDEALLTLFYAAVAAAAEQRPSGLSPARLLAALAGVLGAEAAAELCVDLLSDPAIPPYPVVRLLLAAVKGCVGSEEAAALRALVCPLTGALGSASEAGLLTLDVSPLLRRMRRFVA